MSTPAKPQTAERSRYRDGWLAWSRPRKVTADRTPDRPTGNARPAGPADVMACNASHDDTPVTVHDLAGSRRDQSPQARLHAADERDVIAHNRDLAALTRDQVSDARNLELAQRERHDVLAPTDARLLLLLTPGPERGTPAR